MKTPLLVATPMTVTDGKGSVAYVVLGETTCDVAARREVLFVFPRLSSSFIHEMCTCPQENVWLSVSTYGGEIYRIRGEEVQPVLAELVRLYRAMEKLEERNAVAGRKGAGD